MPIPTYDELFNPLLEALRQIGGSGSIQEQEDRVAEILGLSDDDMSEIHRGTATKVGYRLAWARTYLKNFGLLENSARGVWALTPRGHGTPTVDPAEVKRVVREQARRNRTVTTDDSGDPGEQPETAWQDELLEVVKSITAEAFERLCQRLLRESGFTHVEVTARGPDGGIDGKGVVRLGGVLSFHVVFQSKRYKYSVRAPVVRDFRGAMVGRADKGLIITTGTFTRDARREAQRDGTTPIDLIDGEELVNKLKELRMGVDVKERISEDVLVDHDWFASI